MASPDRQELRTVAQRLNRHFRLNGSVSGVIEDLQRFPRPIAVDFNGVIANGHYPLKLNPEAPAFLDELRKIGNVVIVTGSAGPGIWDHLHDFLKEHKIWYPDLVLMVVHNYEQIADLNPQNVEGAAIRQRYFDSVKDQEWFSEKDYIPWRSDKLVATFFGKPWRIPLIDDYKENLDRNPGVFPVLVKRWAPREDYWYEDERWFDESGWDRLKEVNKGRPSLLEAVEIVRQYYASFDRSH